MSTRYEYAGFWIRLAASIVDTLLVMLLTIPMLISYYGFETYWIAAQSGHLLGLGEIIISWLLPFGATIAFWIKKQATPGKILFSLKVLDEKTGQPISLQQSIIRYLGYFVSTIGLLLGFIWVAFDAKKQGWHDKMAGTVVVRDLALDVIPVLVD